MTGSVRDQVSDSGAGPASRSGDGNVLDVRNLKTYFFTRRGVVKAVDGASFSVAAGETLGIVGESGSGKSMTSLSVLRLLPKPAGRIVDGEIVFCGESLLAKSERDMQRLRGQQIGMILQDPMSSLNPVFTIGNQVMEPLRQHKGMSKSDAWREAESLLARVRIPSPERRLRQYPHEMSGGMRQRIVTAIGLSCTPKLLIADEPTTSLDVTIQAQILVLLRRLQSELGLAMILITHDLGVVATICDRVAVMYAGRMVETAATDDLFASPKHPYTVALLNSLPRLEARRERLYSIPGQPPDLSKPMSGCAFAPRCPKAMAICRTEYPPEFNVGQGHSASCWLRKDEDRP